MASNFAADGTNPSIRQNLFFSDQGLEIYSPNSHKYVTRTWDSLSLCNSPYHPLCLTPEGWVKVRWHIYYEITYWTSLSPALSFSLNMSEKGDGGGTGVNGLIVNQTKRCSIMLKHPLLVRPCVAPGNWQVFCSSTTCKNAVHTSHHGYLFTALLKRVSKNIVL